jgi:type VI secretion system protein VasD
MGGLGTNVASSACKFMLVATCLTVSACGTTSDGSGMLDRGLQAVGLQRPQPQMPTLDGASGTVPGNVLTLSRKVTLRLHAGDVLNTDASGRSLSVVARIYKLRDKTAFESAP